MYVTPGVSVRNPITESRMLVGGASGATYSATDSKADRECLHLIQTYEIEHS